MPFTNSRSAYEFDPQDDDYQSAGGLPGLLRDAMRRQGLQQGSQADSTANAGPNPYSDGYGNPQGLFGRLLALQTTQGSPIGMRQEAGSSGAAAMATPVEYRIPVPLGPFRPYPVFPPDSQPVPQIPMPHLHLPEPWSTIGKVMQLLPGLMRDRLIKQEDENCPNCQAKEDASTDGARKRPGGPGDPKPPLPAVLSPSIAPEQADHGSGNGGGGGGGGGDGGGNRPSEEECNEQWQSARGECDAVAAGRKGREYGAPYAKWSGKPWDYDECVAGLVSEDCGGKPKKWEPDKLKRKKK